MDKDQEAQLADLKRIKHDWEEGGENRPPFPLDDLLSELEGKPKSKRRDR
ncbi:hypothetical protein LCGC14_2662240 [marine sediment metagenome]|uniref:Uncharacterized protein n=1 Tax=marine sediment metagenome TaxID=412755 RepID=A0A0F9CIJ4_9ZZZZ